MPSKSRKKIKGQLRKANKATKAVAADIAANNSEQHVNVRGRSLVHLPSYCSSFCYHGQAKHTSDVCVQFITSFFHSYECITTPQHVKNALKAAYDEFPEAANSNTNRDILKKSLVSNGASALLGMCGTHNAEIAYGCAAALMYIDSYTPSYPVPSGNLDQRDAKMLMTNVDILNGCSRSLVKFFVNQIPCNCLDESYAKVKTTIPKKGMCANCKQMKVRSSLYICTGCERSQFCSKACQIAHVPEHKKYCKRMQRYDRAHNPR